MLKSEFIALALHLRCGLNNYYSYNQGPSTWCGKSLGRTTLNSDPVLAVHAQLIFVCGLWTVQAGTLTVHEKT